MQSRQTWKPILVVATLWGLAILLFIIEIIANNSRTPIRLTKDNIIGDYRIDTSFYNGANSRWQFDRFRFTITPTDSIYFFVTNKDTINKTFKEKILYSSGPPDLWSLWKLKNDTAYHVIKYPPTLYRGHKKFYYVLKSDFYGNMFFRKVDK
jgi:hypothetical protein